MRKLTRILRSQKKLNELFVGSGFYIEPKSGYILEFNDTNKPVGNVNYTQKIISVPYPQNKFFCLAFPHEMEHINHIVVLQKIRPVLRVIDRIPILFILCYLLYQLFDPWYELITDFRAKTMGIYLKEKNYLCLLELLFPVLIILAFISFILGFPIYIEYAGLKIGNKTKE